ncbi:hypothetical protein KUV59_17545 [Marinobacter daepoensis]|uniref:hypothetical protein n=1 Tax=Marinobacter daepoensis TaxID=262077 RepID=UPI001C982220|nr:hypothetical protein [Marinobacter daepoensis]MBY6034982.1 hypothetical protein [Marinobacter daepoensis]
MNVITCDGQWIQGAQGIECTGTLHSIPYQDMRVLFQEYLSPDPAMIGLVMGSGLVFWAVGIGLSRVVQVMRKVS